jgi:uncharacterized protein (TIGR03437 family)
MAEWNRQGSVRQSNYGMMEFIMRKILAAFFLVALVPVLVLAQEAPGAIFPGRKLAGDATKSAGVARAATLLGRESGSEYRLEAWKAGQAVPSRAGLVTRGVRRALPSNAMRQGQVRTLSDGRRVWFLRLSVPGAVALRVRLEDFHDTAGAVWVYSETGEAEGPFTGRGPLGDGAFWSPTVNGSSLIVEYQEEQAGAGAFVPPFRVEALSQRWAEESAVAVAAPAEPRSAALFCHVDATCFSQYAAQATATVQFNFEADDGGSYVCSGSMINTRSSSFRPYMITAHHCLSSDAEARSVEAFFQYGTTACDGTPLAKTRLPKVLGARFLEGASWGEGDYAFVLLNGDPPAGTSFLGWNTGGFELGDTAIGLHHPAGSFRRFSRGNRTADRAARIEGQTAPAERFFSMQWSTGLTEGGSSGSPLLNANNQIIGTLSFGPVPPPGRTLCDLNPRTSGYGRFANAYPSIQKYLDDAPSASLSASPLALGFGIENGRVSTASPLSVTVNTSSSTALALSAVSSAAWLRVQSAPATLSAAQPATVVVNVDPAQFSRSTTATATLRLSAGAATPVLVNVTVNVVVRQSNVTIEVNPNPVYESTPDSDGYAWFYDLSLRESGGVAARITSLSIDGTSYNDSIVEFFGTDRLNASGLLSVSLGSRGVRAPANRVYRVGGVDSESGRVWTATLTVPFLARPRQAVLSMSSAPATVRNDPNSADCPWFHQLVLTENGGFPVTLNRFIAAGTDLSSDIAGYFGTTRLAANGSLRGGICWTGIVAPERLDFEISGTDTNGLRVTITANASFTGPLANPNRFAVAPSSVTRSVAAGAGAAGGGALSPAQISISLPAAADWSGRLVFANPPTTWLSIFPLSGRGPANLTANLSASGLAAGTYAATLLLESTDALPQTFSIPIQLNVGGSGAAAEINPAGLVNNASYQLGAAPGMLLSLFGLRLAPGTGQAQALPLPSTLQGVSAAINGRTAPLLFVSPGQINLQVPYETEPGNATLTLSVNGVTSRQTLPVFASLPGIYTSNGRDIVPNATGRAGQPFVFFITGQGAVTPSVATGQAPSNALPINGLPRPLLPVQVSVGGQPAELLFFGIPYGLAGVSQINIVIPPGLPPGTHAVVVRVGDRLSPPAFLRL